MPSISKLSDLNRRYNFSSEGISILHGPHHVAQKLIRRYLPLNCERLTSLPSRFFRVKLLAVRFVSSLAATWEQVIVMTNVTVKAVKKSGNQNLDM